MGFDANTLFELLPAIYRIRDRAIADQLVLLTAAEQAELEALTDAISTLTPQQAARLHALRDKQQRGPLETLMLLLASQIGTLEENLAQLYDDQFIETCADWVVPYIGDLVGYRTLYHVGGLAQTDRLGSPRAEVANTIAYRRRKGTASMLEQLARDVTSWDAAVVEFFQYLATTQFLNHLRPENRTTPDLRQWRSLNWLQTPFDPIPHTVDVRRISRGRGRYNIPNIGIFLWQVRSYPLLDSPAFRVDGRRFLFNPLGANLQLYNLPQTETTITQLAMPVNVPLPLSRRQLYAELDTHYGEGKSLWITIGTEVQPITAVEVCNLSDLEADPDSSAWPYMNQTKIAIDPELGRIVFPADIPPDVPVYVSFHYGFTADLGGGAYDRTASLPATTPATAPIQIPTEAATIQDALTNRGDRTLLEIQGNGRYAATDLVIQVAADTQLQLYAANGSRPLLELTNSGLLVGEDSGEITLDGLLIAGGQLIVPAQFNGQPNRLQKLRLRHCTLVPGLALHRDGMARTALPSLVVETANTILEIESCILGAIRINRGSQTQIHRSIVDALTADQFAYAGLAADSAAGSLEITESTMIGKLHADRLSLAENSIFLAEPAPSDPPDRPVLQVEARQQGCVHFCYLPLNAHVPRRYHCQPQTIEQARRVLPQFNSTQYGHPSYCQLHPACAAEIRRGAADESEMGVFHDLYASQCETNLQIRLAEYLRFSLEAGVFYAS